MCFTPFFFKNCMNSSWVNVTALSETITSGKPSEANNHFKYLIVDEDVAKFVMYTIIHSECASI